MASLKYYVQFARAFVSRFKVVILGAAMIGVFIFLLSNLLVPSLLGAKTQRVGLTGRYTPDELPDWLLETVGDGLTRINTDGLLEPSLASTWETPDKGKTWIFHLDSSKKWQDGQNIKSQDINYQFSDVEVEKPDSKTVIFKLKDPFSPFPSVVARPVFKTGFLGTDSSSVENISLAGTYVESVSIKGEVNKIYKFYPNEERTKLAFEMGQVDTISDIIDAKPLDSWATNNSQKNIKHNEIVTLFFNNDDDIFKDNKDLRQALDYAINKEQFEGERAISPIPPDSWVYNSQVKPYAYNIDRAKELVKISKIPTGTEIKLVTSPILLTQAEQIAHNWNELGLKTIIQVSSVIPTDFQAYLAILDVPRDPDQYSIWHSTQKDSSNISKFASRRIDKLLEDGRLELNPEERRKIYIDFQRFIVEELPAAFLYHPVTYTITRL